MCQADPADMDDMANMVTAMAMAMDMAMNLSRKTQNKSGNSFLKGKLHIELLTG